MILAAESAADGRIPLVARQADAVLFRGAQLTITASAFLADVARCAARLPDADHVVNCCTSRYWFAVGFAAALLRGQISLLTGVQSAHMLAALGARYSRVSSLADTPGLDTPLPHCVIGPAPSPPASPGGVPLLAADAVAAIVFTSGSTGAPSGTAKTFAELVARSRAAAHRFGFDETRRATVIGTVPPHHMYGFETTVLLPLHVPVASWCDPVFFPADLQQALAAVPPPAVLVTTPLQLRALLEIGAPAHTPQTVISATAPLDSGLASRAEQLWNTEVLEIFGATEVGSIASRRTLAGAAWSLYPGLRMAGEDAPLISAPDAPARRLNDVVQLLDNGAGFSLVGRCGDMVKLGGRRASLAGLSRLLNEVDGVADGVFLAPDDLESRPNARLMALVVAPCLSGEDVLKALRDRIDPVFMPRPIVRVPALPRDKLGKLPRQALLSLLARHAAPPRAWT